MGLISASDARLRAARDGYNRRVAQEEEQSRLLKKKIRTEADFPRRWVRNVRKVVRGGVRELRLKDMMIRVKLKGKAVKWLEKKERRQKFDEDA